MMAYDPKYPLKYFGKKLLQARVLLKTILGNGLQFLITITLWIKIASINFS